jgi:hypothetical protein
MSDQERQTRENPAEKPESPAELQTPEQPTSLMGRVGRAVTSFDESLSGRLPDAIEDASKRTADSARKGIQSGLWQNYAFLAVLAVVAITLVVLLAKGCSAGGAL